MIWGARMHIVESERDYHNNMIMNVKWVHTQIAEHR